MAHFFLHLDLNRIFVPTMSVLEIFIRGSLVYFLILFLLHLLRKQSGSISVTDLLVIVLLGNAVQNAIIADTVSITDGVLLAGVIILWNLTFDYLAYRFVFFRKLVHPPPIPLIKDGKLIAKNLRREFITQEELLSQLREQGVDRIEDVRIANLEGDGRISVIGRQ